MIRNTGLATLMVTLAACGGSGGNGSGNQVNATCDATIFTGGPGGLTGDAGYQGLHYYVNEDLLCALDVVSGTSFEVDEGLTDLTPVPVLDGDVSQDTLYEPVANNRTIKGVVYVANNNLRFARTEGGSSAPPAPEIISSEAGGGNVDVLRVASDYENTDDSAIAYRKVEDGTVSWHQVQLSHTAQTEPHDFAEGEMVISEIRSYEAGRPTGWLVYRDTTADIWIVNLNGDASVLPVNVDGQYPTIFQNPAPTRVTDLPGGFDNLLIAASVSGKTPENRLLRYRQGGLFDLGGFERSAFGLLDTDTSDLGAFYYTQSNANTLTLFRATASNGIEEIDSEPAADDSDTAFVIATQDRVVWAYNKDAGAQVRAVDKNGDNPEVLYNTSNTLSSPIRGSGSDGTWVFFNETDTDTFSFTAHAVPDNNGTAREEFPDAHWVGATQTATDYAPEPAKEPVHIAFLLEDSGSFTQLSADQELFAVDSSSPDMPDSKISLGELEQETLGPSVFMAGFGLGPHRLMRSANDLIYVDTSANDSAQTLLSPDGVIKTIEGF